MFFQKQWLGFVFLSLLLPCAALAGDFDPADGLPDRDSELQQSLETLQAELRELQKKSDQYKNWRIERRDERFKKCVAQLVDAHSAYEATVLQKECMRRYSPERPFGTPTITRARIGALRMDIAAIKKNLFAREQNRSAHKIGAHALQAVTAAQSGSSPAVSEASRKAVFDHLGIFADSLRREHFESQPATSD